MASYRRVDRIRRANSAFMTTLTGALHVAGGRRVVNYPCPHCLAGNRPLNWQFLTDRPRPVGEGGGSETRLSVPLLLLISSAFGLPLGICVGVYLSEFARHAARG